MENKYLEKIREIAELFILLNETKFCLFVENNKWCIRGGEDLKYESSNLENLIKMLKKYLENRENRVSQD